jgi:hypothetical protein
MADAAYTLLNRLSEGGAGRFSNCVGLAAPASDAASHRRRIKVTLAVIRNAREEQRDNLDIIAANIIALSELDELAELALRAVCEPQPSLLNLLESHLSLEGRLQSVSLHEPAVLDQARNLAMTFHWKQGRRYSASFTVGTPQPLTKTISPAVKAISKLVQELRGGRKVHVEHFTY